MVKLLVKSVVLSACVYGLVGCSGGMPSCSDKEVQEALQEEFKKMAKKDISKDKSIPPEGKDLMLENISFNIDSFITESADEKAKKVTCKAKAKMDMNLTDEVQDKMLKIALGAKYEAIKDDDEAIKKIKEEMKKHFKGELDQEQEGKYTAQRTDDGKINIDISSGFKF